MEKRAIAIELEFQEALGRKSIAAHSINDARYNNYQRYNHFKGRINKVIKPIGLEADYNEEDVAVEIRHKKPHLWSMKEASQIKKMCRKLSDKAIHSKVEYSPGWNGLHVHVDVRDFDVEQMKNLMRWVVLVEPYIRKEIAPERRKLWTCAKTKISSLALLKHYDNVDELVFKAYCKPNLPYYSRSRRTIEDLREEDKDNCRFCGANFHSYLIRGSVEFRWFEATLDAEKATTYINFCYNLVIAARYHKPKKMNEKIFRQLFQAI